jgi:hypothetical protein
MTFAAGDTVTDPAGVDVEVLCDALTFDSLPGVAEPLDGVAAELLDDGPSINAELGGTSAADGGTVPTDAD